MHSMAMSNEPELQHLKRVSRVKHEILTGYLPAWARILQTSVRVMYYVDCFAGPGRYECNGELVDGSPVIAVKAAKEFAVKFPEAKLGIVLIEDDPQQHQNLNSCLEATKPYSDNLRVQVKLANSREVTPSIVERIRSRGASAAFFVVDPYGHPLSISVMNDMLALPRSELFINLMWYRINMNLDNPTVEHLVTALFGDDEWKHQRFMKLRGQEREESFLEYFCGLLTAQYLLPFKVRYDAMEDRVAGSRTKYYLLHASNNLKAVQLMKEVMWKLGDEEGTFDFSGSEQGILISETPQMEELKNILLRDFSGQQVAFDDIRARTWKLPYIEKHYRQTLQSLRDAGVVQVTPVTSKGKGLSGRDRVRFPKVE